MIPLVRAGDALSQDQARVWDQWLSQLDPPMPLGVRITPDLINQALAWHNQGRPATPAGPEHPRTDPPRILAAVRTPRTSPSPLGAFLASNLDPEQRRKAAFADLGDQLIRARWRH